MPRPAAASIHSAETSVGSQVTLRIGKVVAGIIAYSWVFSQVYVRGLTLWLRCVYDDINREAEAQGEAYELICAFGLIPNMCTRSVD